jgi:putative Mg2+ transporter-C (MgtC) family protein
MGTHVSWLELALRLLLTVIAGSLVGFDRGEHPRPVGLRTTLLVCLAASVAMMQAALLMDSAGKPTDSFVVLDLMRFPLGILSGIGFIGAGAILRRGDAVRGVTTAATLWFVTVIGLCLGGGQLVLGMVGTGLALAVLAVGRRVEGRIPNLHRGCMAVISKPDGPSEGLIRERLAADGFSVHSCAIRCIPEKEMEWDFELYWRSPREAARRPALIDELSRHPAILKVGWTPQA